MPVRARSGPITTTPAVGRAHDLAGEDLEDNAELKAEVARVIAAVRADRARRKRLEEERETAVAKDSTHLPRFNRPEVQNKPKVPRKKVTEVTEQKGKIAAAVAPGRGPGRGAGPVHGQVHADGALEDERAWGLSLELRRSRLSA